MQMVLGEAFARSARKNPSKTAIIDDKGRLTYGQLNERVNRLVNGLKGLGFRKGDRVAVLSRNCIPMMEIILANLKLGLTTVPIVVRGTKKDYANQLKQCEISTFFYHQEFSGTVQDLKAELPELKNTLGFEGSTPEATWSYDEILGKSAPTEIAERIEEEDPAFILFTGGTTGHPKGAILTHQNLLWNAINYMIEGNCPLPHDRVYYTMQLYHSAALSRFLSFMFAGGTYRVSPDFDPEKYLKVVEEDRSTFVVGNTAIWRLLLEANRRRRRDTSSVRVHMHGQSTLYPSLKKEIGEELFPSSELHVTYALTEASPQVSILKPTDRPAHWSSVGRPYISTEVRIADPDNDQPLAQGETGQILVRGPSVMKGYYNNPQETENTLRGGWLHTGDLGRFDELGYLYAVDRLKDMIKTGGINVFASEVEEVIVAHPEVLEAAVIGVPDEKWGETIRAIVVKKPQSRLEPQSIIEYCKNNLASHKKPTSVVFLDSLPRGSFGGKVLKKELREKYGRP